MRCTRNFYLIILQNKKEDRLKLSIAYYDVTQLFKKGHASKNTIFNILIGMNRKNISQSVSPFQYLEKWPNCAFCILFYRQQKSSDYQ